MSDDGDHGGHDDGGHDEGDHSHDGHGDHGGHGHDDHSHGHEEFVSGGQKMDEHNGWGSKTSVSSSYKDYITAYQASHETDTPLSHLPDKNKVDMSLKTGNGHTHEATTDEQDKERAAAYRAKIDTLTYDDVQVIFNHAPDAQDRKDFTFDVLHTAPNFRQAQALLEKRAAREIAEAKGLEEIVESGELDMGIDQGSSEGHRLLYILQTAWNTLFGRKALNAIHKENLAKSKGEKRLYILLHGTEQNAQGTWLGYLKAAKEMGIHNIFALDHGYMDVQKEYSRIKAQIRDLKRKTGAQEVYIIAHSWGTWLGRYYTNRHPQEVKHVIDLGGPAGDLKYGTGLLKLEAKLKGGEDHFSKLNEALSFEESYSGNQAKHTCFLDIKDEFLGGNLPKAGIMKGAYTNIVTNVGGHAGLLYNPAFQRYVLNVATAPDSFSTFRYMEKGSKAGNPYPENISHIGQGIAPGYEPMKPTYSLGASQIRNIVRPLAGNVGHR